MSTAALHRQTVPSAVRNTVRILAGKVTNARNSHRLPPGKPCSATINFIRSTNCRAVAEIGVAGGATSLELARFLNGAGHLWLFDRRRRAGQVRERLLRAGYANVTAFDSSDKAMDSYNWDLMRLLEQNDSPIFDYVFLDGAHTWAHDALAFLLLDRLLKPGGYIDFDDYDWTLDRSPSVNPRVYPTTAKRYTEEQIETKQVAKIVDILVRRDTRYREVVAEKIFRKE